MTAGRTKVSVQSHARCPFSIADDYATEYLRRAEAGGPESTIRVPWRLPLPALSRRVAISFGIHLDLVEPGRNHDEVRFWWTSGTRFLPDFRGTMRLRIDQADTRILVDGEYDVPFGLLGHLFDLAIGRRMARASLQELADRVAHYLEDREWSWRAAHPASSL